MIIAITGRIGSGKSTVSKELSKRLRAIIVDADKVAKEITSTGGRAVSSVSNIFGEAFVKNGAMDRDKMRELVFSNAQAKSLLEKTLKPFIQEQMNSELFEAQHSADYVIIDIPLLVGSEWITKVDFIIVVDVPESTQLERIQKRNGHSVETVMNMMNAQPSRKEYQNLATYLFDNKSYESFDSHIMKCINEIQKKKKTL